jgi:hypothetical protein
MIESFSSENKSEYYSFLHSLILSMAIDDVKSFSLDELISHLTRYQNLYRNSDMDFGEAANTFKTENICLGLIEKMCTVYSDTLSLNKKIITVN